MKAQQQWQKRKELRKFFRLHRKISIKLKNLPLMRKKLPQIRKIFRRLTEVKWVENSHIPTQELTKS